MESKERIKQVLYSSARLVLAAAFLFSGITKGVDPLGTAYKIQDYLIHFGLNEWVPDWCYPYMGMAVAGLEFYLGLCLLFGFRRRMTWVLSFLLMLVMTPLTLYLAITDAVADCGCFGDAWVLSNWATFGKNVVLCVCVGCWWWGIHKENNWLSDNTRWLISVYGLFFILLLMGHCLYHLPIADFRPYKIGNNLVELVTIPEGQQEPTYETTFILEKHGTQREFTLADYPDSTWTFVDSRTRQISEGYVPPLHDFILERVSDGELVTEEVLNDSGYTFLVVAYNLMTAQDGVADLLNELHDYCQQYGYTFYALTASGDEAIAEWQYETGAEYEFCRVDAIPLKTMVRSNPGLVLLKAGVVVNKWGVNDLPQTENLNAPLDKVEWAQPSPDPNYYRLWLVLAFALILPLGIIVLLDRVWAGLRLIGKMRNNSEISNLLKKRTNEKEHCSR